MGEERNTRRNLSKRKQTRRNLSKRKQTRRNLSKRKQTKNYYGGGKVSRGIWNAFVGIITVATFIPWFLSCVWISFMLVIPTKKTKEFTSLLIEARTNDNLDDTVNKKQLLTSLFSLIDTLVHTYDCFAGKNKGDGQRWIDEHNKWSFLLEFISHRANVMGEYKPLQTILDSGKQVVFILNSFRQDCKTALDACEKDNEPCAYLLAHNRNGMDALAEFDIPDDSKQNSVELKKEVNKHCYGKKVDPATAPSSTMGSDNSPHAQHPAEVDDLLGGGVKEEPDKGKKEKKKKGTTTVKVQPKSMADVAGTVTTVRDVTQKLGYGLHHSKCIQESHVDNLTKLLTSALLVCAKVLIAFLAGGSGTHVIAAGLYAAFVIINLALTAFSDDRVSPRGPELLLLVGGKLVTLLIVLSPDAVDAGVITAADVTDVTVETDVTDVTTEADETDVTDVTVETDVTTEAAEADVTDVTDVTDDLSATGPDASELGLDAAATVTAAEGVVAEGVAADSVGVMGQFNAAKLDQSVGQIGPRVIPSSKVIPGNNNLLSGNYNDPKVSSNGKVFSGDIRPGAKFGKSTELPPLLSAEKLEELQKEQEAWRASQRTSAPGTVEPQQSDVGLTSRNARALDFVESQSDETLTPGGLSGVKSTSGLRSMMSEVNKTGVRADGLIENVTDAANDGAAAHGHGDDVDDVDTIYLGEKEPLGKELVAKGSAEGKKVQGKRSVMDFFAKRGGGGEGAYTRLLNMKTTLLKLFKAHGLPTDEELIFDNILHIAYHGGKALNQFDTGQGAAQRGPSRSVLKTQVTKMGTVLRDLFNEQDSFYPRQFALTAVYTALAGTGEPGTRFNMLNNLTSFIFGGKSSVIMRLIKTLSNLAKRINKKKGGNMRRNNVKTKNRTKNRRNIRKTIRKL